jgi:DMSO/TMAO reductase YedYZ molybdopterin-dependent catalytic subunit
MSNDVVTESPLNRHVSWEGLNHSITPTEHFFCRNHNPFPEPPTTLDWAGHELTVDQLSQMNMSHVVMTLECAGNGRTEFSPVPTGTPWGIRGVSTGRFSGVLVADLVNKYPSKSELEHLIFVGADQGPDGYYERSLTIKQAIQLGALVALQMNGEPLTLKHGAPFRLIVPGYYAMTSIKWLKSAAYSPTASEGYYQIQDYLVEYPNSGLPVRPATLIKPKSIITAPQQGEQASSQVVIKGKAWGHGSVSSVAVEVSAEGASEKWTSAAARLDQQFSEHAWCSFELTLSLEPGRYRVRSIATVGQETQPLMAPWNSQGYENNSAHVVEFEVSLP